MRADGPLESAAVSSELSRAVTDSADAAALNAPVPTLLLDLQVLLGNIAASVTASTERGRRPFRPGPDWDKRLGELGYGLYLLADQSATDLDTAVRARAAELHRVGQAQQQRAEGDWPFEEH